MRLPKLLAVCEYCHENAPEMSCYPPEEVAWGPRCRKWLCYECWAEQENIGEEQDLSPLAFAKDAMLGTEDQLQRLIAAATRKRMGVKT